ncbi:hypothetical protein B9G39_28975 [Zooshikella ganghwensis]|uniref:Uncharacterized protein n=1 Tax=Zooshikella ganghwensis TaxID=202772 RepID=A0A4P9VG06_9GAMM|nr:hypothetical protein B9G39_28975 [Zooshikella ganghwensis]
MYQIVYRLMTGCMAAEEILYFCQWFPFFSSYYLAFCHECILQIKYSAEIMLPEMVMFEGIC